MKYIAFIGSLVFLSSCGGWSDTDKANFKEKCEKAKFNLDYCDCALEKVVNKYATFDEMTKSPENEMATGDLFIECIEKDIEQ